MVGERSQDRGAVVDLGVAAPPVSAEVAPAGAAPFVDGKILPAAGTPVAPAVIEASPGRLRLWWEQWGLAVAAALCWVFLALALLLPGSYHSTRRW